MNSRMALSSCLIAVLLFTPLTSRGQFQGGPDPEAVKARNERIMGITEQVLSEVPGLRLPRNRAVVYALAGDIYWRFDQERAIALFRSSAGEIQAHYQEAVVARVNQPAAVMATAGNPMDIRAEILPMVSRRDADLALELLYLTRPPDIAEALARFPADVVVPAANDPAQGLASRERSMEQRFQQQAAASDPERAKKFIRESLAKGPTEHVLPLLEMLRQKEPEVALELGAEVIRKAADADLAKNQAYFSTAVSFLRFAARPLPTGSGPRPFNFSADQTRELANKLVTAYLQNPSPVISLSTIQWAMPTIERFAPERAAQLKQRVTQNLAKSQSQRPGQGQPRLWSPASTPEELAAIIPKIQNASERASASSMLASKIAQLPDLERAKMLIDQIPDLGQRARAAEQLEARKALLATRDGKFDDARSLIDGLKDRRTKVQRLVALSMQYRLRNTPEAIEMAKGTLNEARALIGEIPEDGDDIQDLMEILRGYSMVEPDIAFKYFEGLIPYFNEIIHSAAVMDRFARRTRSFEKGELVMKVNNTTGDEVLLFRYVPHMQMMGRADLERMNSLTERFARGDTRVIVRMLVLRAVIQ